MSKQEADVLICGAGAAGLTLALELARRGVAFRLVEKMREPFPGSRGRGIQPRTQELFEDLGILDRVTALGGLYPPLRAWRPDGSYADTHVAESGGPTPAEPYTLPLMVPQYLTEAAMRERLLELGQCVEFGVELQGFEQDGEGVTATLGGPDGVQDVRVRYLAGTDGGRSTVRRLLGIGFPGKTLGVRALVADVALTGIDRSAWHRFNDGDMEKQVGLCPLPGTALFQLQAPVPPDGDVDSSAASLTALIAARTGRMDIAVHAVRWASVYTMNARLAERYRMGRVFLAGDAAHVHPPTGGQGLNTSVQDAYNLGWKLAAALRGAHDALLDSYEAERRPVAESVLGLSTRLLDAARQGDLRRGRDVQQLDLAYPDSPLAFEAPPRTQGIRAGARAPDAPVRGAGGQATRLFALFAGPHWTLLADDAGPASLAALRRPGLRVHHVGPHGDVIDVSGHFRAAYGTQPGDLVLVRPDGYVGAVATTSTIDALDGYLRSVGL